MSTQIRDPKISALTQKYLKEALHYSPETGVFTWKKRPREHFNSDRGWWQWNGRFPGRPAGYTRPDGYRAIQLLGRLVYEHRLAWLYTFGKEPLPCVDHINRDPRDNRLCNLREASYAQNLANSKISAKNTSGFRGVTFCKRDRAWYASVGASGTGGGYIGSFKTAREAAEAVDRTASFKYGPFASLNFPEANHHR